MERDATWRRLVAAKYGETNMGWTSSSLEGVGGCGAWANICKGRCFFFSVLLNSRSIMERESISGMTHGVGGRRWLTCFCLVIIWQKANGER